MPISVIIKFPDTGYIRPLDVEYQGQATNLRGLIFDLAEEHSHLKRLITDEGNLHHGFIAFVNEEDVKSGQRLDTPINDGDEIFIIPSFIGG